MNSIINISQPLYGQLLEVQKKDNSNSNVSAETQPTQKVILNIKSITVFICTVNFFQTLPEIIAFSHGKVNHKECF